MKDEIESSVAQRPTDHQVDQVAAILDVDHIAVAVEDLELGVQWYRDSLGFKLLERRHTEGRNTGMVSAVMQCGKAVVVLIQGTSAESQVSRFIREFGPGVQHVAFSVANLDASVASLIRSGGGAATEVTRDLGIRQVFLRRDPGSGVRVELIERRGGTFTDQTVEELFRKFEADNIY